MISLFIYIYFFICIFSQLVIVSQVQSFCERFWLKKIRTGLLFGNNLLFRQMNQERQRIQAWLYRPGLNLAKHLRDWHTDRAWWQLTVKHDWSIKQEGSWYLLISFLLPLVLSHCQGQSLMPEHTTQGVLDEHRDLSIRDTDCWTLKPLPESVGLEGGIGVDVVMQPPLHCHVPIAHAMTDLHTEVSVVAVDVLDGSEVILLFSRGIRAGHEGEKKTNFQQQNKNSNKEWVSNHWCILF